MIKKILIWTFGIAAVLLVGLMIAGYALEKFVLSKEGDGAAGTAGKPAPLTQAQVAQLVHRLTSQAPRNLYIVVDTAANRLYVKNDQTVLKEAVISCGSGDILEEPGGSRKWIFDTPRGEFSVTSKLVNPTWIKPDWAFIEDGEKPPADYNERIDNDTLGAYALGFGDGFFIHGTLYTRLLGRNVTHGCVRVGDQDLSDIFHMVPTGSQIYIY
jgi:lipoprotein-anchoring transpeptidase ErfK/SrfK